MSEYYMAQIQTALKGCGFIDEEIAKMNWQQMFDEYCEWHGLINWGPNLRNMVDYLSGGSHNQRKGQEERPEPAHMWTGNWHTTRR